MNALAEANHKLAGAMMAITVLKTGELPKTGMAVVAQLDQPGERLPRIKAGQRA